MMNLRGFMAGLLIAVFTPVIAFAQQQPPGGTPPGTTPRLPPVSQPPTYIQSNSGLSVPAYAPPPVSPGFQYPPPGGYYSPYGGVPYIQTPAAGYLSGAADVTTANGQYLSQVQQGRILQAQADSAKLDLRRKFAEQQRYLKSLEPTPEEVRQKEIHDSIERSRNNPPSTEIWSGKALNALLISIQRTQRSGGAGPTVQLDPTMLPHINLTTGTTTAGAGMLKNLKRFQWPFVLLDDSFDQNRTEIEKLARQAADGAASGSVDAKTVFKLQKSINDMIAALKAKIDDITPTQYVQAMRYLREVNDSIKVLQDPNVANYLSDKYMATGSTVGELVQGMSSRGLTFAPAASGDEPWYTALHGAMVTYDYGLSQLATARH